MQPKRMGTKEHTSSPDGHSKLSPSGSEQFRYERRGRASACASSGSASCSDLVHIAYAARRLVRCSRRADGDQAKRNSAASLQNTSPQFRARAIRHLASDHSAPYETKPLRTPTADVAPDFTRMSQPSPA